MTTTARLSLLLLTCCALILGAPRADAQRGFDTKRLPVHGLQYLEPRSYDWLPVQPSEDWVVLKYTKKKGDGEDDLVRGYVPQFVVVRIDWVPDVEVQGDGRTTTGGDAEKPKKESDEESGEEGESDAAPPPPPPINSALRWFDQRSGGWKISSSKEGRERNGYTATEYVMTPPENFRGDAVGWAYVWRKDRERTYVVFGRCSSADLDEEKKIWWEVATKMQFSDPVASDASKIRTKWERTYARKKLLDPEFRIRVRERLGGSWEAEDTDNYIVVYNTPDQPLVRRILKDIEAMRAEYEKLFPSAAPVTAVSTVRVCADRDEYMLYGGMAGSAGYWNWYTEELVLYDATVREKGQKTDKSNTFIVLYHEAFHQYIHYSAGQLAPHSWFNEGYGDFFSGSQVSGSKVKRIGANPWRNDYIKKVVEARKSVPWKDILYFEQRDYYRNPGVCYAQGWSMIYFLNTSKDVQRNPEWRNLLTNYFETLKELWAVELAKLKLDGSDEIPQAKYEAEVKVRREACEKTFKDVDVEALDEAWKQFVRDLPWIEEPK
ncbi:MAG: DUF1570 domain-containing protein, partial [Planctomycetes bacterium]|nr:DUF1570 domain-containing protein [Planctomycetota bacterium]